MANTLFDIYKEALLGGGNHGGTLVNLTSDTIKVSLIDTGTYNPDTVNDEDLADVTPDPRVPTGGGSDQTLGSITTTNGTFDAADSTFTSITGNSIEELMIWKDTATASTSILLVSFDTATGLTGGLTPNGGDIVIQWNGSGIFSL